MKIRRTAMSRHRIMIGIFFVTLGEGLAAINYGADGFSSLGRIRRNGSRRRRRRVDTLAGCMISSCWRWRDEIMPEDITQLARSDAWAHAIISFASRDWRDMLGDLFGVPAITL